MSWCYGRRFEGRETSPLIDLDLWNTLLVGETSPRGRRPPRWLWGARRRRIVPGLYVSVLGFLTRRIERGGTAARRVAPRSTPRKKKAPNSPRDSKVRRAVLYLSTLSVPPAFSIAGATREAKIALSIDLIDLKFA